MFLLDNEYYDYNVYWLFFNDQGQVDEIFIVVDAHVVNGVIVPVD